MELLTRIDGASLLRMQYYSESLFFNAVIEAGDCNTVTEACNC